MHHLFRFFTGLSLLGAWTAASAGPIYTVYPLPIPSGWTVGYAQSINNSGQSAGSGDFFASTGYITSPAGASEIMVPDGFSHIRAWAINDAGQVVGWGQNAFGQWQAFIGTTSDADAIPLPEGWWWSQAYAINNSGEVTGLGSSDAGPQGLFVGSTAGSTALALPPGYDVGYAFGINDSEEITGTLRNDDGDHFSAFTATLGGGYTMLPMIDGWTDMWGYGINNSGTVAGYGYNEYGWTQPFLYTPGGGSVALLSDWIGARPNTDQTNPLNNRGQVVGYFQGGHGGWLWDPVGGVTYLSGVDGWYIDNVRSINDHGQILAYGWRPGQQAETASFLLLDPVPEPGTAALFAAGLLGVALLRLRRR
jgi:hypothetical protein